MTAAHACELPPHSAAPAEALDAAVDGRVVYLTRDGEPAAAIVPAGVATAGAAAIEARETLRTFGAPARRGSILLRTFRLEDVLAVYADDLAAYPDER